MVADCDQPRRPKEGDFCYNCESPDHYGKDCPEEQKPRQDTRECYNCLQTGHIGRDCPEPRKSQGRRGNQGNGDGPADAGGVFGAANADMAYQDVRWPKDCQIIQN